MKKTFNVFLILFLLCVIGFEVYELFKNDDSNINNNENTSIKESNESNKESIIIKYFTYEGNGKFTMSSTANRVSDFKKIKNNYYIKEEINNEKSDDKIVEVLYNDFESEPYLYGYYTNEEFNKYFEEQIKNGLVCDDKTEIGFGEGVNIKCVEHDTGFEYEKIDSKLCAYINDKEICINANDWENIDDYKKQFENVGWICEYKNNDNGKWSEDERPVNGYLECSKEKPSTNKHTSNELFCNIGSEGASVCNNNDGWCSINNDLNTYCFGVN